jgi:hypothetical protein
VEDRDAFLQALGAGAPWGGTVRKVAVEGASYPGLDGLLRRVGR